MKILWNFVILVYCVSLNKYLKEKKNGAQTKNGTKENEKKKKQKPAQANYKTTQFASRNWINQAPVSFYIVNNSRDMSSKRFLITLLKLC